MCKKVVRDFCTENTSNHPVLDVHEMEIHHGRPTLSLLDVQPKTPAKVTNKDNDRVSPSPSNNAQARPPYLFRLFHPWRDSPRGRLYQARVRHRVRLETTPFPVVHHQANHT